MSSSTQNRPANGRNGCFGSLLNLISLMILLVGLLLILAVAAFFFAPDRVNALLADTPLSRLLAQEEPLPVVQPTVAAVAVLPTATAELGGGNTAVLQPTWTPLATQAAVDAPTQPVAPAATNEPTATPTFPTFTPTPTHTATPTLTPTPSNTPTVTPIGPTATPSPTRSSFPFTKSDDSPFYHRNFANNAGCGWLGIAGEVLDLNRNPVAVGSYVVHVWDSGVNERVEAGSAPAYGPSGWEQFVFNSVVVRTYKVQLETPQGTPVSQVYTVQTRASCNENLLQINFVQNH